MSLLAWGTIAPIPSLGRAWGTLCRTRSQGTLSRITIPVVSLMRSKYGTYPEYHTSLDDLRLISPTGLAGAFGALQRCISLIEANGTYRTTCLGEPQLGRRGLYPTLSELGGSGLEVHTMMNILAYADGQRDLVSLAERIGVPAETCIPIIARLLHERLLERID